METAKRLEVSIPMAVNEKGYVRPTYDELLEGRIAQAKELFGDDIDVSDASPFGKFIRLAVQDLADAYEAQEIIYYARFPNTATGQNLDRLMPFAGITRNPATYAEHSVKFTGTGGYTIPMGFLVGTTGDEEFFLENALTLDSNGTGTGTVQCTEQGAVGNVAVGAITEIVNPSMDVTSVEHLSVVQYGRGEETDEELRERFEEAINGTGSATLEAIRGAVLRVSGVRSCIVEENDGDTASSSGIPAHSFETFVYAPQSADQAVAEAIFSKKPLGIKTHGSVSKTVTDASGNTQTVKFSRITEVTVHVKLTVTTDTRFELDGASQIKNAIVGYVDSLSGGDDVIYTSLYRYIYGVVGVVEVTSLKVSTDGTEWTTANISIASNQVAVLSASNVEVTET